MGEEGREGQRRAEEGRERRRAEIQMNRHYNECGSLSLSPYL